MFQNHEDWRAKTPTIILDIPGIQAKEHHTDEKLRSLTLKPLVLPNHLSPGQELTQIGQQKRQQKVAEVELSSSFLVADPSGSLWLQGRSQQTTELMPMPCLQNLHQKGTLPTNTVFLTDCQFILQSLQLPEGDQIFINIKQQLSLLKRTKHL